MVILDLKNEIIAELPRHADILVEFHMLQAVKDLCRKTYAYEEEISTVSVVDQAVYPLASTIANTKLISLIDGKYKGSPIFICPVSQLESMDGKWDTRKGTPDAIVYKGGNSALLNRIPDVAGDPIIFRISILPTKITSELPEVIENSHIEAIKNYVQWKAYGSDSVNNQAKARLHKDEYESMRDNLKRKVLLDYSSLYTVQIEGGFD